MIKFLLFLFAFNSRLGWISDNLVLSECFKNSDASVSPVTVWGVFLYENKKFATQVAINKFPLF